MKIYFGYWSLLTIAMLGGLPPSLLRAEDAPAWQLRATIETDSSGLFLDQLFLNPPAVLPHITVAVPRITFSQTVTFSRAQIAEMLRQHATGLVVSNWTGPTQVKISRRKRQLEETELKTLLTETLQREYVKEKGELELHFTRGWVAVTVPDDPLTMRIIEMPVSGVSPNFIVRFEISADHEVVGKWQMPVQARIWREIWVAGSALQRGQLLRDADLTRERRDVLTLRDFLLLPDNNNAALEIAESIQAGLPLTSRSVRLRPVIRRGRVADAVVQDGPMVISVRVEALEDGVPGQMIRVRNLNSKREFRGKVENEGTIFVSL